ncbi:hypothetical protein DVS28_b0043 (plasmid) [Euzebya pacifica]|uniref:Uncharacterized protein n=1 Tax=Euzebya pacifica TaxID=1608957 RepID=A0A346Y5R6_9ACTN|nr:hypothetical protein [Euzebya pacifica]AXV09813.1 hypothetical protein DVS28_b0043 [Euzebya pacifica]
MRPDPHHEAIARDLVFGLAAGHPFPIAVAEPVGVWRALYLAFSVIFGDARQDGWEADELTAAILGSTYRPDPRWDALVTGLVHRLCTHQDNTRTARTSSDGTDPDGIRDLFSRNLPLEPCRQTIAVITEIVVALADATIPTNGPMDLAAECGDAIARGAALPLT